MSRKEEFIDLNYKPRKDLICLFSVTPNNVGIRKAANTIALESSVGTWSRVPGLDKVKKLGGKVFEIKRNKIKIAYPQELFELGNLPSILSGIAGNIFGMKILKRLRLEDVKIPKKLLKSFEGPKYGIGGVRRRVGVKKRPLVGTIVKPKLGLNPDKHAEYAYKAWKGGLDLVKSDENLTNQKFNRFKKRFKKTIKMKEKVEKETGERKIYIENITAETEEMIKRGRYIQENSGNGMMVDIITTGWAGFQTLRKEDLNLIMHVHRAGHGMFTYGEQGMSMLTLSKLIRMVGGDELHIGGIFGKMKGEEEKVKLIKNEIQKKKVKKPLKQDWVKIKPMMGICSGGLHPGLVGKLIKSLGNDIIIQAGGGVAGHPSGIEAGGKALRQGVEGVMEGNSLKEYSKNHKELKEALEFWK